MRIKRKNIYIILAALCLALSAPFLFNHYNDYKQAESRWKAIASDVNELADKFSGTVAVSIKDMDRSFEISIRPDEKIPSASIVKVPIMACLYRSVKERGLSLDKKIPLEYKDKVGGSGILKNKRSGAEFTVKELTELMITISDNTACNMLINLLGFDYINTAFKAFGLRDTNLSRLMMDMRSRSKGIENYTTARDMARILERAYNKNLISKEASSECLDMLKEQKSKDRIPARLPKDTVIAHKTGLERSVCHDVGIVFTENGDFIICVLTKHKNRNSWPSKKLISDITYAVYCYYIPD